MAFRATRPQLLSSPRLIAPGLLALCLACGESARGQGDSRGFTGGTAAGGGNSLGGLAVEGGGENGACQREVTLQAVILGEPAPFDLVIVADHSDSLGWSRDDLAAGLRDLLTNVQGRDVRIFLLTPTQYGESSSLARKALTGDAVVSWQDPETGNAYAPAMTDYEQHCTSPDGVSIACPDPKGAVPYVVEGTWSFAMPDPIAIITAGMTDAEFAAEQQAVSERILALGGTGSSHEQPLCTLARYVSQDRAQLPDNAVFLIISDEDDVSSPADCLVSFKSELRAHQQEQSSSACSTDCDVYRYEMTGLRHWERWPFTCAAFSDTGELIEGTERSSWYNLAAQASCDGIVPGPCTEQEIATVQKVCASGLEVASCQRECATQEIPCRVDLTSPVDACSQPFSYNGQTWPNLAEFCAPQGSGWRDCGGGGLDIQYQTSLSGTYSQKTLMEGTETAAVGNDFETKAQAAFGPGKYLVQGILLDPRFSCPLGDGQSHAANLVRTIGDPSHVFPLCESYAPALAGVLDFAQALIQTEFTLSLKEDEHVTAVVVIRADGSERALAPGDYSFDEATGRLTITPAAITSTDSNLRVEVTSDCRPIVK